MTHPQLSILSLWPSHFILSGALSRSPLFPCSILDTFQPGGLIFPCHTFCLLIQFMRFSWQYTGVACHFLLQWVTFCQNFPQWPIHLGWPYTAWLIASLQAPLPEQVLWLTWNEALMPESCGNCTESHEKTQRSRHAGIKTKLGKKKETQANISKRKVFIRQ